MSLKATAKKAADVAAAAAAEQAERQREAKLQSRREYIVKTLSPLVTDDDITVLDLTFAVARMQEKSRGGTYGPVSRRWEPVIYKGTRFQVDDIEVLVWDDNQHGRYEQRLGVLRQCSQCETAVLPGSDWGAHYISTIYDGTDDPDKLEYRRKEITAQIGKALAGRKLCARHTADKINARCEHCGRTYGTEGI